MENQQLVSSSRQCSSSPVGFSQGFLSKEQCDNTGTPLYSPDLATAYLYLFRRLKSALKGLRFYDAIDIVKNATEELKSISRMAARNDNRTLQSLAGAYSCVSGLFGSKYNLKLV